MPKIIRSDRLEKLLETRQNAAYEQADSTCTAGYDNDGSRGTEIHENGVELGLKMAAQNLDAYVGTVSCGSADVAFFVLADSEEAACARVETWPEGNDDEIPDDEG